MTFFLVVYLETSVESRKENSGWTGGLEIDVSQYDVV